MSEAQAHGQELSVGQRHLPANSATVALGTAMGFIVLASCAALLVDADGSKAIDMSSWTLRGTLSASPYEPAASRPWPAGAPLHGVAKPV